MLIDRPLDKDSYQDLWGLVIAINDIYDRHPEKFGSPETRRLLKAEINTYIDDFLAEPDGTPSTSSPWCIMGEPEFYEFVADRLKQHGLNPFAETKLTTIGTYNEGLGDTLKAAKPLLKLFEKVTTIISQNGNILTTQNAATYAAAKMDYVITGNAINDPILRTPEDSFIACGMLLKKGGRAIHMLEYGSDSKVVFDHPDLCSKAGQQHLYNIPPHPFSSMGTKAMVLEQVREIEHAAPAKTIMEEYEAKGRIHPSSSLGI